MPARTISSITFSRNGGTCTSLLVVLLFAASLSSAGVITVRKDGTGDFAIFHEALSVAADGDSILIGPGEFTEMTWVRLPGWSWDVQVCGYATADDLTILGSGSGQTEIGPLSFVGSNGTYSPIVIAYVGGSHISIQDLVARNSYHGAYIIGTLEMDRCVIDNNRIGILWFAGGSGGWVRDTSIQSAQPLSPTGLWVKANGGGSAISMQRCHSVGVETIVDGIEGMTIEDSEFSDEIVGVSIYDNASVYLRNSIVTSMSRYGVVFSLGSNGFCEITDSEVSGDYAALYTGGSALYGQFVVYGSRLQGGSQAVLFARYRPRPCLIMACDLIKGSGPVVQCGPSYETVTHDLRHNYWGTASEADIQAWIVDHNDDPEIPATVLYSPFDGQPVFVESTTWGGLKVLYR